tara:strand:- start:4967 stop:6574 length:1608 start_codon:yes stop_codon:yes gene_type:complete
MTLVLNIFKNSIFSIGFNFPTLITLFLFILMTISILNIKIFSINPKVIKYLTLLTVFIKIINSYEDFLEVNQDSVAWVVTALRMDELNLFEYQASWDHKGSLIYWVYFGIYKMFKVSNNLWANYSIMFIVISYVISYYCYKILLKEEKESTLLPFLVSTLIFLNLIFSPGEGYPVFDTRFLGSALIFFSIYNTLKGAFIPSSVFLALAVICLPSYALTAATLFIYIIYINKDKQEKIKKIITSFFGVNLLYLLYLYLTSQLLDFYNLSIKYNLMLRGVGTYFPFEKIVENNTYLFLIFIFSTVLINPLYKKFDKSFLIIYLWGVLSLAHLVLTGPRFVQYDQLIIISLNLLGFYLIRWVVNFIKLQKENTIFKNLIYILIISVPLNIASISIIQSLEITNIKSSNVFQNFQEIFLFEDDSLVYKEKPKFALFYVDGTDWKAVMDSYNFLPSTRVWQLYWHKRDSSWAESFNWDELISNEEFENVFFSDLINEKPQYAIIDINYLESHGNYLYSYVLNNYEIINCEKKYCIYEINK